MRPQLAGLAAAQSGLVTRAQAVKAGHTERELRTLTGVRGGWVTVRRGVYLERDRWSAYDEEERLLSRDLAARLVMATPHVMSHDSAARLHALPMLRVEAPLSHITRAGVRGSRTEHGVKHHLTRLALAPAADTVAPATSMARTVLDIAREHGVPAGVVAVDAALRRGVTLQELEVELRPMTCWPGITASRAAVALADPGAESPGESIARLLVSELGLGAPATQFPLPVGGSVAWADLRLGRLVIEFDGVAKYRATEAGGLANRTVEQVVLAERHREQAIMELGLGVARLVWSDCFGTTVRRRTLARLRAAYDSATNRYGATLPPELIAFAQRMSSARVARLRAPESRRTRL